MKKMYGRVAVVTGSSSGIGRACAVELARRGCHVALVDVNEEGMAQTARLLETYRHNVSQHVVDVADKERMAALPQEVLDAHGAVHILINNAGVSHASTFEDATLEDFEWIVGINFWGVVYGCKFFLPHLKAQDEAHITNISSIFGIIGLPTQSSYAATKFAVRGMTESLRYELAETNIGLTCVHPGAINTNIVAAARFHLGKEVQERSQRMFAKRGMPPEVAGRLIVQAIEDNNPRLIITRAAYLIDALKRVYPALPSKWVHNSWKKWF